MNVKPFLSLCKIFTINYFENTFYVTYILLTKNTERKILIRLDRRKGQKYALRHWGNEATIMTWHNPVFRFWQVIVPKGKSSEILEVSENEGQWRVTGDLLFYLCGHYVVISAECIQIYTLSAIMCFWRIVYIHIDMFEQEMLEVSPDESQQSTFNPFTRYLLLSTLERCVFDSHLV